MPNTTPMPQSPSTIMPRGTAPSANPGTPSSMQVPMMGQNVQVAQPTPDRPVSIPEAVMMQALMRRMGQ